MDIISLSFGIPYEHVLGHHGINPFNLLCFAAGFFDTVMAFFRNEGLSHKRTILLASYFALITASHSILDGLTNGGLGVALLAPFDNSRYFFPFRSIDVSPIGLAFFRERGYTVIKSEIIWVWVPALSVILLKVLLGGTFVKK